MSDFFVDLLKTSLSGGIVIALILLLRYVFRKTPKALICVCWTLAILRLLLPFSIETNWSLQPSTANLTDRLESVQIHETNSAMQGLQVLNGQELPTVVSRGLNAAQIFSIVWFMGAAIMLGYALVSYLRLRKRVGKCLQLSNGVYGCSDLDTAFLFGYFRPRIYLPDTNEHVTRYMLLHEQAHLRRGDHWLMLAGYIALCFHWFNPLVWVCYIFLCRDIESACDERVIRTLDTEQRKEYASALLSCGKHRSFPVSCPVAFGEVSIKQRIMGVLNYRKPTLWLCVVLLAAMACVGVFFLTDTVEYPPYYMELMNCLGDPLPTVYERLGIDEETVHSEAYHVETPLYVEYAGVVFRVELFTIGKPERLCNFAYYAIFDANDPETDAKIAKLARQMYKLYGPGIHASIGSAPDQFKNISAQDIAAIYKGNSEILPGPSNIGDYWDITDCGHGKLESYLNWWSESEYFADKSSEYPMIVNPSYMVRFSAYYYRDSGMKEVYISYKQYKEYISDFKATKG